MFSMKQSASDKFCTLCQETVQQNFLASCQGQADYFPKKNVKEEIKRNQSYKQILPRLSCTLRRFGHRTEETSSCSVWDSGAAESSQAHQLKGLLQFVLHMGLKADRCLAGLQGLASGPCAERIPGEHPLRLQTLPHGALLLPWHLSLWTIANLPPFSLLTLPSPLLLPLLPPS